MGEKLLLKGGKAYAQGRIAPADLLVEEGRIQAMGPDLDVRDARVINLQGKILSPGFVDLHVHLREPGFSYKETIRTGTLAAAAGGFTTVCAMPNLSPVPDCLEALEQELELIRRDALVEVLPYAAITRGEKGEALCDMEDLAPLCAGFSDDGKGVRSRELMREAMVRAAALGCLIAAHCEDESLIPLGGCVHKGAAARFGLAGIPSRSEWLPIQRDIGLVEETGARYHVCHVSAKKSVALIQDAKQRGLPVTCECTPHQLFFCEEDILKDHGRYKMNPPLRGREDREAILEGLCDGTIDLIATDHAPHSREEKRRGLHGSSFGVVGLETAFAACYTALVKTGRMTLEGLLDKLTAAPAGILRRERELKAGAPADIAVLDVEEEWTVDPERFFSMGRATPFEGVRLTGKVPMTFFRGRQVFGIL